MAKVGYGRVSTEAQNEARQIAYFEKIGVDEIFLDKITGSTAKREGLQEMKKYLRKGDEVYITEISRLARSTRDFLDLVEFFTNKGVRLVSEKESIDTETPQGKFMLTVFSAIAELERETIKQRQLEGIAVAKAEKKYKGRKPIEVDMPKFRKECAKWRAGQQTAVETFEKMGLTKTTFYKLVKEYNL